MAVAGFLDVITRAMPDAEIDDRDAYEILLSALLVLPEVERDRVAAEVERLADNRINPFRHHP